jgi:hypothetical protein
VIKWSSGGLISEIVKGKSAEEEAIAFVNLMTKAQEMEVILTQQDILNTTEITIVKAA